MNCNDDNQKMPEHILSEDRAYNREYAHIEALGRAKQKLRDMAKDKIQQAGEMPNSYGVMVWSGLSE